MFVFHASFFKIFLKKVPQTTYTDPMSPIQATKNLMITPAHVENTELLSVFRGVDKQKDLLEMLPQKMKRAIEALPKEYLALAPEQLQELIKRDAKNKKQLTTTDHRLRLSLWQCYDAAFATKKEMHMRHVFSGICSGDYFYDVLKHPHKLAWLICPIPDYLKASEECLLLSTERVRELLTIPMVDKDGKVNVQVANLILKAHQMLDTRVKGAIVHKAQIHTVTENITPPKEELSLEEMQEKIKLLEEKNVTTDTESPGE